MMEKRTVSQLRACQPMEEHNRCLEGRKLNRSKNQQRKSLTHQKSMTNVREIKKEMVKNQSSQEQKDAEGKKQKGVIEVEKIPPQQSIADR